MTVTLVRPASGGLAGFGATSPVRVRPAPATDPPDDDFLASWPEPSWAFPEAPPTGPLPAPLPTPLPTGPLLSGRHRAGDAHRATRRYLDLTIEVLGGFRPIGHLRPLTDTAHFDEVARQLARLGGPPVVRPGSGLARVTGDRVRLRHLRICEVREGAVEAAAVLARGDAVRAMTLRLERRADIRRLAGPAQVPAHDIRRLADPAQAPAQDDAWLCMHLAVL